MLLGGAFGSAKLLGPSGLCRGPRHCHRTHERPMTRAVSKIKRLVELSAEIYIARDLRCRLEQCHECKCQRDVEDEGRGQRTDTETEHVETHRGV